MICAANRNSRRVSQSRSISSSSSSLNGPGERVWRAASKWPFLMISTVSWNAEASETPEGTAGVVGLDVGDPFLVTPERVKGDGEPERSSSCDKDEMELRTESRPAPDSLSLPKKPEPTRLGKKGVCAPLLGRAEVG